MDIYRGKAESYQILPKAYLEKCGFKTREVYGQVANITYISKDVKTVLRKKTPQEYKENLEQLLSSEEIKASLLANDIPESIFEADAGNVEEILAARRKAMAQKVKSYYQSL